jgi:hypothetical protein
VRAAANAHESQGTSEYADMLERVDKSARWTLDGDLGSQMRDRLSQLDHVDDVLKTLNDFFRAVDKCVSVCVCW